MKTLRGLTLNGMAFQFHKARPGAARLGLLHCVIRAVVWRYLNDVACRFRPLIQALLNRFVNGEYFKWASRSTWDVISELTADAQLRALLCGQVQYLDA